MYVFGNRKEIYMNFNQIKDVEKELWSAADELRVNSKLTAAEYKDPVLGLILLRFAENRFDETLKKIDRKLNGKHFYFLFRFSTY